MATPSPPTPGVIALAEPEALVPATLAPPPPPPDPPFTSGRLKPVPPALP